MKGKSELFVICVLAGIVLIFLLTSEDETLVEPASIVGKKTAKVSADFRLPYNTAFQIVKRPFFTLSYNEQHEQANWVAYTLYPNNEDSTVIRKNRFKPDPLVTTLSASLQDYKGSGYDRGHLAPSKALSYSQEANDASFFMSNMSPQLPDFNRGIWKKIEAKVFEWSNKSDSLYVVTGPVLDKIIDTIGENEVSVPGAYYKTILRFNRSKLTGIAFMIENKKSAGGIESFLTAIDTVEKRTQIDFYFRLDTLRQQKVEGNMSLENFIN